MADTPVLDKLSKDLSIKIFDPVSDGKDDGKTFSKELRLSYINRGYGNMVRTMEAIAPDITKIFRDYYVVLDIGSLVERADVTETANSGSGNAWTLSGPYDIFDVYYYGAEEPGISKERAEVLDPDNYLVSKYNINDLYTASRTSRKWTIIQNQLRLLPDTDPKAKYYNVTALARNDFAPFTHGGSTDISIPGDYYDILITIAAIEAMSDKGDSTKYQLYTATLNSKLELIALSKKLKNVAEEGKK